MNKNLSVQADEAHQLENKKENITIGSIVSNLAHPYTSNNANILITTYAHFTPPLMIVVEKNYGVSYNVSNGEKEDKSSYKCLYYSTFNGSFEANWFKGREPPPFDSGSTPVKSCKKNRFILTRQTD